MKAELFDRLDDYKCVKSSEEVKEEMEARGYEVVFPKDNELQIDIDTEEEFATFKSQLEMLRNHAKASTFSYETTESFSGLPHRHITVRHNYSKDFFKDQHKRIAYQAALGSDVKREMLNLLGHDLYDDATPVLFIKKKEGE